MKGHLFQWVQQVLPPAKPLLATLSEGIDLALQGVQAVQTLRPGWRGSENPRGGLSQLPATTTMDQKPLQLKCLKCHVRANLIG